MADLTGAIDRLKGGWRSLPGPDQQDKTITMDKVSELFKNNLSNELNGKSNIALPVGTTLDTPAKVKTP